MIELGVPYELKSFKHDDVKKPPFTELNPNGRVPGTSCITVIHSWSNNGSNRRPEHRLDTLGVWSNCPVFD